MRLSHAATVSFSSLLAISSSLRGCFEERRCYATTQFARQGLPQSLRVAPFYSQPERLNPNHSPLHTTAIPTRTVS